jgi:hypothetical protein
MRKTRIRAGTKGKAAPIEKMVENMAQRLSPSNFK